MASTVDAAGEPIPTSSVLMAAAKHIGTRCRNENLAFLKCKKDDPNPEKCLDKGRQVTQCVLHLWQVQSFKFEVSDLRSVVGCWGMGIFHGD
ncbi:UNVERIFIED_CONTAM: NADH dehydrogenase [ubiquinone] 1 alpha subcomplex subunit-B [Sesamum radiatum]|uniref:NADH dehydrogenase [ubiquinone] 1 alpha subcomplex subunit-B n=1 Tax=Sesamum radiatum TaxID=300843 RepID=A0AAW2KB50_SESRA